MAAPNTNYSTSLLATTIELYAANVLGDVVHERTPLLAYLRKHQKPYEGGHKVVEPLVYATSTQSKWFAKGDTFSTAEEEIATNAEFAWKNVGIPLVIFDQDLMDNAGRQQQVNLAEAKMTWAKNQLAAKISSEMFLTSQSTNGPVPLPVMIDATSTVGGLNSTTYSWWQSQVDSDVEALTTAMMENIYNSCLKLEGAEETDAIMADQITYEGYGELGGPMVRVAESAMPKELNLGFSGYAFRNAAIYFEPQCTSGAMYFLNPTLRWRPHTQCAKGYKSQVERAENQPAVIHLLWQRVALTCGNRASLGKLTGKTAP